MVVSGSGRGRRWSAVRRVTAMVVGRRQREVAVAGVSDGGDNACGCRRRLVVVIRAGDGGRWQRWWWVAEGDSGGGRVVAIDGECWRSRWVAVVAGGNGSGRC
ncbi:hypothetical protein HanIR_Chr17g0866111 [Helianthus annuus]|nr:hypothetical protein HanIR_Chr17g0866111 [Helianthus annuus]